MGVIHPYLKSVRMVHKWMDNDVVRYTRRYATISGILECFIALCVSTKKVPSGEVWVHEERVHEVKIISSPTWAYYRIYVLAIYR